MKGARYSRNFGSEARVERQRGCSAEKAQDGAGDCDVILGTSKNLEF